MAEGGQEQRRLLPVTVLSGFLGAGKTTLLKHLLRSGISGAGGEPGRMAVLVNDMGEINFDASEIKDSRLIQEEAQMVELHNGCICCTLRADLLQTVRALSEEQDFDYLVVESTGISEPLGVAQTFTMDIEEAVTRSGGKAPFKTLSNFARLDTMATVVDALNLQQVLGSLETLSERNVSGMVGNTGLRGEREAEPERGGAAAFWKTVRGAAWTVLTAGLAIGRPPPPPADDRGLARLLLDQVEFANVLVLSKAHLLERPEAAGEMEGLLRRLNPDARVLVPREEKFADLPASALLQTELFDMDKAEDSLEWREALKKEVVSETQEYGVASAVFREHLRPFHPARLKAALAGLERGYDEGLLAPSASGGGEHGGERGPFRGVVRAKGRVWLASAHAHPVDLQSAGRLLSLEANERPFLAALPQEEFDELAREQFAVALKERKADGRWHEDSGYGDRDTQLIFIGVRLDEAAISAALRGALVTDEELRGGPELWRAFEDVYFDGRYFRPFVPGMSYE